MMFEKFETIISALIDTNEKNGASSIFDPIEQFNENPTEIACIARSINSAFLIALAGEKHPSEKKAKQLIEHLSESSEWSDIAGFYSNGIDLVRYEIEEVCRRDSGFLQQIKSVSEWLSDKKNKDKDREKAEKVWSVFFPEGNGILENKREGIERLRAKRSITIADLNRDPINHPASEILFTSNALLTIPPSSLSIDESNLSDDLKKSLDEIAGEPQLYWYDHPVQVGVEPKKNEIIYGLRGLDEAFEFESERGELSNDIRPVFVLSVSVTHRGLQQIARKYIEEEIRQSSPLKNIDVCVFTEADTERIIDEVIKPAAIHYMKYEEPSKLLRVFGVDGEYGRHYSFLKAISVFWNILIQKRIRATFKIDLDQVFPQKELLKATGLSAFEHFKTPLWGAHATDIEGQTLELGMIAGALVNKEDIGKSLFTPDVIFPDRLLSPDEYVFFSALPQALSTEAEMMARYNKNKYDGEKRCIRRIHITGGTNGILIDSLRRHRPFTPSFIGRAEDQAYILSVLTNPGRKLAYLHKDGLVMRHDKDTFAQEAIQSAYISKLVGDYIRIIYFSSYAGVLTKDISILKKILDPFTGCFISKIPVTVTLLRFVLKAATLFMEGKEGQGIEFIRTGAGRINAALNFTDGKKSLLRQKYEEERTGWNMFYDTLLAVEDGLRKGDNFAYNLQKRAESIINSCLISF